MPASYRSIGSCHTSRHCNSPSPAWKTPWTCNASLKLEPMGIRIRYCFFSSLFWKDIARGVEAWWLPLCLELCMCMYSHIYTLSVKDYCWNRLSGKAIFGGQSPFNPFWCRCIRCSLFGSTVLLIAMEVGSEELTSLATLAAFGWFHVKIPILDVLCQLL